MNKGRERDEGSVCVSKKECMSACVCVCVSERERRFLSWNTSSSLIFIYSVSHFWWPCEKTTKAWLGGADVSSNSATRRMDPVFTNWTFCLRRVCAVGIILKAIPVQCRDATSMKATPTHDKMSIRFALTTPLFYWCVVLLFQYFSGRIKSYQSLALYKRRRKEGFVFS